ncbi:MAG: glycosyltransferase [Euzebya sp.]
MALAVFRADLVADVMHVHDWTAGQAARLPAESMEVGIVATIHATERGRHQCHLPPGFSPWIDDQERRLVAAADQVVVCAAHMAGHLCTIWRPHPIV